MEDETNYKITYTTMNKMNSNPAFKLTFPSTVSVENPLTTCEIIYNSNTYPMTCSVTGNVITI